MGARSKYLESQPTCMASKIGTAKSTPILTNVLISSKFLKIPPFSGGISRISVAVVQKCTYVENGWKCHKPVHLRLELLSSCQLELSWCWVDCAHGVGTLLGETVLGWNCHHGVGWNFHGVWGGIFVVLWLEYRGVLGETVSWNGGHGVWWNVHGGAG
jgi:hypothetical protein